MPNLHGPSVAGDQGKPFLTDEDDSATAKDYAVIVDNLEALVAEGPVPGEYKATVDSASDSLPDCAECPIPLEKRVCRTPEGGGATAVGRNHIK